MNFWDRGRSSLDRMTGFLLLTLEPGNRVCVFHQCVSHGRWWATQTAHRSCGSCWNQASRDTFAGNPGHQ